MRWADLKPGHVLVSTRTDRVHLVTRVWRNSAATEFEAFSLTTQRWMDGIKTTEDEIWEYEVLMSGEGGQP
jgi:hypothetical protein